MSDSKKVEKLERRFHIPCYATDVNCGLRPAAFMDMTQELANRHADILGFGFDQLQQTRTAWVLSRMHFRFNSYPKWRDEMTLRTWHKGPEGLFYLRDFQLLGDDGSVCVEATTSWLVVNIDTRRLVRGVVLDETTACHDHAIEESCDRIQMPKDVDPVPAGVHRVGYSDIDMNGHTNNAMYLVWAMDALDYAVTSSRPVREVKINFNQETRPGDDVEFFRAVLEEGTTARHWVEGKVAGKSVFCAEILF